MKTHSRPFALYFQYHLLAVVLFLVEVSLPLGASEPHPPGSTSEIEKHITLKGVRWERCLENIRPSAFGSGHWPDPPPISPASQTVSSFNYRVDNETMGSLSIDEILPETVGQYIRTTEGNSLFLNWLRNPLLDAHQIRQRQDAIRWFINHPEERSQIRQGLARIHSLARGQRAETIIDELVGLYGPRFDSSRSFRGHSATWASVVTLDIVSYFQWTYPKSISEIAPFLVSLLYLGTANKKIMENRELIFKVGEIFKILDGFDAILRHEQSPNENLQNLHLKLSAITDPIHPQSVSKAHREIQSRVNRVFEVIGNLTFLTNSSTQTKAEAIIDKFKEIELLFEAMAELDILTGLAEFQVQNSSTYHFPTFREQKETYLSITNGHHPYLLGSSDKVSVPNSIVIQTPSTNSRDPSTTGPFYLMTGQNAGGKSTYLKMIGTLTILAQIGAPVPADNMELTPLVLLTVIDVTDSIESDESLFQAQTRRLAELLKRAQRAPHSLSLINEILNGTSPQFHKVFEGRTISYLAKNNIPTVLVTHDREWASLENKFNGFSNIHVSDHPSKPYRVSAGKAANFNALDVMIKAGFPEDFIEDIRQDGGLLEGGEGH